MSYQGNQNIPVLNEDNIGQDDPGEAYSIAENYFGENANTATIKSGDNTMTQGTQTLVSGRSGLSGRATNVDNLKTVDLGSISNEYNGKRDSETQTIRRGNCQEDSKKPEFHD